MYVQRLHATCTEVARRLHTKNAVKMQWQIFFCFCKRYYMINESLNVGQRPTVEQVPTGHKIHSYSKFLSQGRDLRLEFEELGSSETRSQESSEQQTSKQQS